MNKRKSMLVLFAAALAMMLLAVGCTLREGSMQMAAAGSEGSGEADFSGKKIGVPMGSVFDRLAEANLPGCEIEYINVNVDMAVALDAGRIAGYVADEPVARMMVKEYPSHRFDRVLKTAPYCFVFPKNKAKSDRLLEQMNEFITKIKADGTLAEIDSIWFGDDEAAKKVDLEHLTGENGPVTLALSTDVGAPFIYVKEEQYVGYEVDVAARFCREYGYSLKIENANVVGFLASISGGRCDFGASCVTPTEERMASMNFSVPEYDGSVVLVTKDASYHAPDAFDLSHVATEEELARFSGCRVGTLTGTIFDAIAKEKIPGSQPVVLNNNADLAMALESGRIDAYMTDEPVARMLTKGYPEHHMGAAVRRDTYGFVFSKSGSAAQELCQQMNAFLEKIRQDGTLDAIDSLWFGTDETAKTVDYTGLADTNGVLKLGVSTNVGEPFCYLKDGQYAGYDVDVAVRFCRDYGYGIEFVDTDFSGLIASVTVGRCDFGASCITITEERKKSVLFSDPYYEGGIVLVTKEKAPVGSGIQNRFLQSTVRKFESTFIQEGRWRLFASGIGVTLLIILLSVLLGTLLGFGLFLLYRREWPAVNVLINVFSDIMQKTPIVVILMILYYLVFTRSMLNGIWVSVIGFSLTFACAVLALLQVAVGAVGDGQTEATLAMGYTDLHGFMRMILPQALVHFIPGYKGELVNLIKGTAVVGYIAVQDLTKISDIIRSRTYEAFFPLIASAVIYFAIAWLLTLAVRRIQIHTNPERRSAKQILRGVKTK